MAGQTLCRPCRAEVFLLGAFMEFGRFVTASREVRANVQNLSRSDKPRVAVRLKPTEPVVDKRCVAPATLELLRVQQTSLRDAIAFPRAARALKCTATFGTSLRDVSGPNGAARPRKTNEKCPHSRAGRDPRLDAGQDARRCVAEHSCSQRVCYVR